MSISDIIYEHIKFNVIKVHDVHDVCYLSKTSTYVFNSLLPSVVAQYAMNKVWFSIVLAGLL